MKRLRALLDRGTPLDQLIDELAGSLATQVAAQLGVSTQTAHERLKAAFTTALSTTGPSGSGPPQSNAERALTLATRFRQVAELVTRVTKADTGTSIRLIAGQRSDADKAGADPTPTPGITGTPIAAPAPASSLVPTPSDGRAVVTPPALAIATGGDTLLGRTLARAWLADDRRRQAAPVDGAVQSATSRGTAAAAPVSAAATAVTAQLASAHGPVEAFVEAFAGALARDDAAAASTARSGPEAPKLAEATPAPAAAPVVAFAIPVAHDASPIVPPAPASTLPQTPQTDPHAVVDQILRAMSIHTADGQSEVRLRLVPEHLGDVSVTLTVNGGSVNASIVAHTPDAQNALAGGQAQLAKTLADAGLKLQSFSVGLAGGGFAGTRDQPGHQSAGRQPASRRIGAIAGIDDDDPVDELGLLAAPSFGPPVYTATRSLANYLV